MLVFIYLAKGNPLAKVLGIYVFKTGFMSF